MVETLIFVGPTLAAEERQAQSEWAHVRGPVAHGDVFRAVRAGYSQLVIIDGYFDQRAPVWHKEILWALSLGCRVFGAASMGAIRAAELHPYGMRGMGIVFESFRSGLLTRDDEVAIAHRPEAFGYQPVSEALVNMRVTLRRAANDGAISGDAARHFCALAEAMFYPERTYVRIVEQASALPALAADARAFREWLGPARERAIDQKRQDALRLIEEVREGKQEGSRSPPPSFSFAVTEAWHEFVRSQT